MGYYISHTAGSAKPKKTKTTKKKTATKPKKKKVSPKNGLKKFHREVYGSVSVRSAKRKLAEAERMYKKAVRDGVTKFKKKSRETKKCVKTCKTPPRQARPKKKK